MGKSGPKPLKRPPLNEDQKRLAQEYVPLAKRCANRFSDAYNLDIEEIRSVAFEALVKALASGTYDPSRGKLSTFLYTKITFGLKDWIRENKRRLLFRQIPLISVSSENNMSIPDPESERPRELVDVRDESEVLLSRAGVRERLILRMTYFEGKTVPQIGATVGEQRYRILAIKRDALQSLRTISEAGRVI